MARIIVFLWILTVWILSMSQTQAKGPSSRHKHNKDGKFFFCSKIYCIFFYKWDVLGKIFVIDNESFSEGHHRKFINTTTFNDVPLNGVLKK